MLYLVAQISLFLVLATAVGGAVGWSLARLRRPATVVNDDAADGLRRELARTGIEIDRLSHDRDQLADRLDQAAATARRLLDGLAPTSTANDTLAALLRQLGERQRAAPRRPVALHAVLQSGDSCRLTRTLDLSRSGALVEDFDELAPGTAIEFSLELPGDELPVEGRARVVRRGVGGSGQAGVALQFLDLAPGGVQRIRRLVA